MQLTELAPNDLAIIEVIDTDDEKQSMLHAIGIYPTAHISRITKSFGMQPVIVCTAQNCHFAIGYELAAKITVSLATQPPL